MFWYILRFFLIWRLQTVQKALSDEMTTLGAESTVGQAYKNALNKWQTNCSKLAALNKQKYFFASRKRLKDILEDLRIDRSEKLSAINSGGLPWENVPSLNEEVHVTDQEIKILENRVNYYF